MVSEIPHVVIIGAGFAGLTAAQSLKRANVRVTVIDRRNHHLFQPLLYEVATAALSPADIAAPVRTVLARQKNTTVLMGEAFDIDTPNRKVILRDGAIGYDYLIIATGARHSYFGHDDWARLAPGLKTIEDALEIRRRFLLAFESAEREGDENARRAKLTFIVVGGGTTGVELAGTMAEIARKGIPRDFRHIDTSTARVILVEASERVLKQYPQDLSDRAKRDLEALGVEVRLHSLVTEIDDKGVCIGTERVEAENVFWAAGVQASSLGQKLGVATDRTGRPPVQSDLSVANLKNVFVVGDLAHAQSADTGHEVPGIAPAAMQMGRYVAKIIRFEAVHKDASKLRAKGFRYNDKGMLATIGRARAVGLIKGVKVRGPLAWLFWAGIHVMYLIGFRNRLVVMLSWAWAYIVFRRGARIITGQSDLELAQSWVEPEDHSVALEFGERVESRR